MKDIKPAEFAEKYSGVKLALWQKVYLKVLWKYRDQLFLFKRGR